LLSAFRICEAATEVDVFSNAYILLPLAYGSLRSWCRERCSSAKGEELVKIVSTARVPSNPGRSSFMITMLST
jgi:hypothetical protein